MGWPTLHGEKKFVQSWQDLQRIGLLQLVEIDAELRDQAITLYAARPDKAWGLVDCASFVVMGDLGIRDALTADHHFQQAGFRALLNQLGAT